MKTTHTIFFNDFIIFIIKNYCFILLKNLNYFIFFTKCELILYFFYKKVKF